ncbi:DUF3644 domain-containing protein [Microbacterium sp. ASV49]|uniref:DUF3644 domain-containing protein n=1 Tax=Microbacterium candidum TaxID=3041922 RepID=A0ABT7MW01_9MICO|nr:DUF3644 domain-containing protein [Microbacterium sp. ASV49]MDL9978598.1 hypothetical protein [Microbacterium sp. ASV49]
MQKRRQTLLFRDTAVESLTLSIELYNRPSPIGRNHAVPILLGHGFEMLLKAVIFQIRGTVREPGEDKNSHSLGKCIAIAKDDLEIISADEHALLATVKQDRDMATHDTLEIGEQLFWVRLRSAITLFRRVLKDSLDDDLSVLMPARVLPVSTEPVTDMHALVEDEIRAVLSLLAPNTRKGPEARARIRPLLSLDGAATGRMDPPSEAEVAKAEKLLRAGGDWRRVLPGLATLSFDPVSPETGAQEIVLRVGKAADAIPVRAAKPGEEALAYRRMDPQREFGIQLTQFGAKLGLTRQQGYAIIWKLDLKSDDRAYYAMTSQLGNIQFQGLSARALELAKRAIEGGLVVEDATREFNASQRQARVTTSAAKAQ